MNEKTIFPLPAGASISEQAAALAAAAWLMGSPDGSTDSQDLLDEDREAAHGDSVDPPKINR